MHCLRDTTNRVRHKTKYKTEDYQGGHVQSIELKFGVNEREHRATESAIAIKLPADPAWPPLLRNVCWTWQSPPAAKRKHSIDFSINFNPIIRVLGASFPNPAPISDNGKLRVFGRWDACSDRSADYDRPRTHKVKTHPARPGVFTYRCCLAIFAGNL